ncbi:hypothetical protein ACFRJ8_04865 [Arthrobacter sp. NPDC056886]|uniref:hypothetical protein n=1 Tax=Arthrobacter sp. NPDC056886 TaxID=3345960 RepID=UPI0036722867
MTTSDITATGALIVSVISLSWTWLVAYRTRRRVVVSAQASVVGTPRHDGIYNEFFVGVTVRSVGRPAGVESISFEWKDPPTGWGFFRAEGLQLGGYPTASADISDVMGTRRVLQAEEIATWHFRLQAPQGNSQGVDKMYEVRGVVSLTSGEIIRSDHFMIIPDTFFPNEGDLHAEG